MQYCLTKDELAELIDFVAADVPVGNARLRALIENAENWDDELAALTYLFSQILERKLADGEACEALIGNLYAAPDKMFLLVQECDPDFVEYMLSNVRREGLSLEEDLVDLQHRLSGHAYDRTLRYRY